MKTFNTRISHKHDTEANWMTHSDFIPLEGEIIIYDSDTNHTHPRIKVGNGRVRVKDLPFIDKTINYNISSIIGGDLTKNHLEYYSPDKIKVDFANTSNGWKLQLGNNATPDAEIDTYITHNDQNWQQHEVAFTTGADSTIDAQFVKWSQGKDGFLLKDVELLYANGNEPENLVESVTSIEEATVYYDDFSEKKASLNLYKNSTVSNGQLHIDNPTASMYGLLGFYNITLEPYTSYILNFDGSNVKNLARMVIYEGHYNWANTKVLKDTYISSNKQYNIAFTTETSNKISIVFTEWNQGAFHIDINDLRIAKPYVPEIDDFTLYFDSRVNTKGDLSLIYHDGPTTGVVLAQTNINGLIPTSKYVISFDYIGGNGATYLQIGNNSNLVLNEGINITHAQGSTQFVFTPIATSEKLTFITFDNIGCEIGNLSIYPVTESLGDVADTNNPRWSIIDNDYLAEGVSLNCDKPQFGVGAKALGIAVKPNTDYKLCFKTKRTDTDYNNLNWQDYTTFGDDDKIALVSNLPGYEPLQLGGPWVGKVIKDDHRARVRIYPAEDQLFVPELISIDTTFQNIALQATVNFYASGQLIATLNVKQTAGGNGRDLIQAPFQIPVDVRILPFGKSVNLISTLDYIEIIFEPTLVTSGVAQTVQSINHISIYGITETNNTSNLKDNIHQDVYKHTYFPNRVVAPVLVGELDDGSLDWRNL